MQSLLVDLDRLWQRIEDGVWGWGLVDLGEFWEWIEESRADEREVRLLSREMERLLRRLWRLRPPRDGFREWWLERGDWDLSGTEVRLFSREVERLLRRLRRLRPPPGSRRDLDLVVGLHGWKSKVS